MSRFRDIALYVAIAIGLVGAAVLWPIVVPERYAISRTWYMFMIATGFLCLFVMKMYWPYRKLPKVWLLLASLLVAHVGGYSLFLSRLQQFPLVLFLLIVPLEIIATAAIVKLCLNLLPRGVNL